jgi:hypothetical protein
MNSSSQRARDIIDQLTIQLARGWQAYIVAKHVHERRAKKRISSVVYFFDIVEMSCLESTVLTLSKLLVNRADSLTVPYLLNFAEQNPSAFPKAQEALLPDIISRHKEQLDSLEPLIANIKQQRDRTIAHLDKLHVSNPSSVTNVPPLDSYEVERVFKVVHDLINEYAGFLEPSSVLLLEALEPNVIDDVEYLTRLIEKDNKKM